MSEFLFHLPVAIVAFSAGVMVINMCFQKRASRILESVMMTVMTIGAGLMFVAIALMLIQKLTHH